MIRSVTDDLISDSFVREQRYVQLRSLTMRSISGAVSMCRAGEGDGPASTGTGGTTTTLTNGVEESAEERMCRLLGDIATKMEELVVEESEDARQEGVNWCFGHANINLQHFAEST